MSGLQMFLLSPVHFQLSFQECSSVMLSGSSDGASLPFGYIELDIAEASLSLEVRYELDRALSEFIKEHEVTRRV